MLLDAAQAADRTSMTRLAFAIASVGKDDQRAWVAMAMSRDAWSGVLSYFDHAPGEDAEHDLMAVEIRAIIPLDELHLTAIDVNSDDEEAEILVEGDPPLYGPDGRSFPLGAWAWLLRSAGFDCPDPVLDDRDFLYTETKYATGERAWEQVLGWDDLFTPERWRFLDGCGRIFLRVRPDSASWNPPEQNRWRRWRIGHLGGAARSGMTTKLLRGMTKCGGAWSRTTRVYFSSWVLRGSPVSANGLVRHWRVPRTRIFPRNSGSRPS